jgi:hypothetical protein
MVITTGSRRYAFALTKPSSARSRSSNSRYRNSSAEGLVLRGGTHLQIHRQMGEKSIHLLAAHLSRMAPMVEAQEAPQPLLVGRHGAFRIVARLQLLEVALDQPRLT